MNDTFVVSKSGWGYIGYSIALFIFFVILHLDILSYLAFGLILFLAYLYRNPQRESISFERGSVVSPVDGLVTSIEKLSQNDEYGYKVLISSNYSDIGILRAPMNSRVKEFTFVKGTKLSDDLLLSKKLNENATIVFADEGANRVKVKLFSKESFADISLELYQNKKVNESEQFGFMLSGLTTIYIPKNFNLSVGLGSRVSASQILLGSFQV